MVSQIRERQTNPAQHLAKVEERIRKLLNMTIENGCSEEEANSAEGIVLKLLAKYNLRLEDYKQGRQNVYKVYAPTEEQLQRAYCENSPTKAHHYLIISWNDGKCRYCGRPHGVKGWTPDYQTLELAA